MSNTHRLQPGRSAQANANHPLQQSRNIYGQSKLNISSRTTPLHFGQSSSRVPTPIQPGPIPRRSPAPTHMAFKPMTPPTMLVSALKSSNRQVQHPHPGARHEGPAARATPDTQSTVGFPKTANNEGSRFGGSTIGDIGLGRGAAKKESGSKSGVDTKKNEIPTFTQMLKEELFSRGEAAACPKAVVYTVGKGQARQDQRASRSQPSAEQAAYINSLVYTRLPQPRPSKSGAPKPVPRAGEEERTRRRRLAEEKAAAEEEERRQDEWSDEQEFQNYSDGPGDIQEDSPRTSQSMPARRYREEWEQRDDVPSVYRGERRNVQRPERQVETIRDREDRHTTTAQRYEPAVKTEVDMEGVGFNFAPIPERKPMKSAPVADIRQDIVENDLRDARQKYEEERKVKQENILHSRHGIQASKQIKRKIMDVPVLVSGKESGPREEEESDSETEVGNADFIKAIIQSQMDARSAARNLEAGLDANSAKFGGDTLTWAEQEQRRLWEDDNHKEPANDEEESEEGAVEDELDELETSEDDDIPPGPHQTPEEFSAIAAAKVPVAERGVRWKPWSSIGWVVANPKGMPLRAGVNGWGSAKKAAKIKAPKRGFEEMSSGEDGERERGDFGDNKGQVETERQVKKKRAAAAAPTAEVDVSATKVKLEVLDEPSHAVGGRCDESPLDDDDEQYFGEADDKIFEGLM